MWAEHAPDTQNEWVTHGIEKATHGIEKATHGIEKATHGIEKATHGAEWATHGNGMDTFCVTPITSLKIQDS